MDKDDKRLRLLFGRFLEKAGVVTGPQVRQAIQLKTDLHPSLAETALLQEVLTLEQVREIREAQRSEGLLFADAAKKLEVLDEPGLEALREEAKVHSLPLGRVLVLLGAISDDELEEQVEAFHDYNAELNAGCAAVKGAGKK